MLRTVLSSLACVVLVTSLAAPSAAENNDRAPKTPRGQAITGAGRVFVDTPREAFAAPADTISPYLYLNRCTGDCTINGGLINDARSDLSTIPEDGPHTVTEYKNAQGQTGALADAEWAELVQCMKEVYSPFKVTVTDQKPTGVSYTMAVIAGNPGDIGLGNDILGIAPLAADCSAQDNVISFSFANHHGNGARVNNICWTAAQESAHAFGLDHEYVFSDGTSACNDPMTYRVDCGGEKFFRNQAAQCGEMSARLCRCGGSQNSHAKLKNVFGEGQSIIPAPTSTIQTPAMGATVQNGVMVTGMAGSKRGVARVELWLNNFKWGEVKGTKFGPNGQPTPAPYTIPMPAAVPNGVIDIQLKAYDDLGAEGVSPTITVTKGAPCATADSCATGQKCEAGKCFWDPPAGVLGDECTFAQFCVSGMCEGTADLQICTQDCILGAADSCPAEYDCLPSGSQGICFPKDTGGGCCSVGSSEAIWVHAGLAGLVLGLVTRRRRKR